MTDELRQILPNILKNEPLSRHTTFKIGGQARYFCYIDNQESLIRALKFAQSNQIKYFIIGEGSNLLVSDKGFDGLVIKLNFKRITFNKEKIEVSPDFILTQLVGLSVSHGLAGLEFMTGIPGTVGGAVTGNAGAYGGEMAKVVEKVEVLDENYNLKILKNSNLHFNYRFSILKEKNWVITNIFLKLKANDRKKSVELMNKYALDRWQKHPHLPSAGSVFKNISLTKEVVENLNQKNIKIPDKFYEYKKIPAAWLIEQVGLKGQKIGDAQISKKHANHLVNLGKAKADEVVQLISLIKTKVRDKFGIQLEEEIRYVGF